MPKQSREYIFQGYGLLLSKEQENEFCQFTLRDEVNPDMLRSALCFTLERLPYFKQKLCFDDDGPYLSLNNNVCVVYYGNKRRKIPEETNGYLFSVSYEASTVYTQWLHFIADGVGISTFVSVLLGKYCALRYDEPYTAPDIVRDPGIQWEELAHYYLNSPNIDTSPTEDSLFCDEMHELVLCLDRKSVVDSAVNYQVKPISLLSAAFCKVIRACGQNKDISLLLPASFRHVIAHPAALYNCYTPCQIIIKDYDCLSFGELVAALDCSIRKSLLPDNLLSSAAQYYGLLHEMQILKVPLKVKQRIIERQRRSNPSHLVISYMGHFPYSTFLHLSQYLTDVQLTADNKVPFFVSGATLNGQMIFNIKYRYASKDMPELIRKTFEKQHINIISLEKKE